MTAPRPLNYPTIFLRVSIWLAWVVAWIAVGVNSGLPWAILAPAFGGALGGWLGQDFVLHGKLVWSVEESSRLNHPEVWGLRGPGEGE